MEGFPWGGGREEKVKRIRSIIGRHKIDGEKSKMVQETEFKELICTTHGHELRGGWNAGGLGGAGWRGDNGGKSGKLIA